MRNSREAFTLLEVLISIFILFTMGLALLKLDGWIKNEVAKYKEKSLLLYTSTPALYESRRSTLKRDSLYDMTKFTGLRDDELFWLKSISAEIDVGKGKKMTLFKSGDLDLSYMLYPVAVKKESVRVGFVRVVP